MVSRSLTYEHYMSVALSLGRRGLGKTWPNPSVGCVIVSDDFVVGRGVTGNGGRPHAETKALKQAGIKQTDLELIELNEAFASQSLAVIRELDLNPELINVNGGAIALGHPLGCTGAKLSVQLFHEMRKRKLNSKYGAVTMCVGTGQGACGIFEFLN